MTYNAICFKLRAIYAAYDGADLRYNEEETDVFELEDELHNFLLACKTTNDILDFSVENHTIYDSCNRSVGVVSVAAIYKDNRLIHDVLKWERT